MNVSVSEFKSKCTQFIRDVADRNQTIEITKRGKIVAVVVPPEFSNEIDPHKFLGCLEGTVSYVPDWEQPLGEDDWEACN